MTDSGLIVVGSGPAGVSAAEAFREHNSDLPVHILTDDDALPYARPPLSKEYLRGESDDVAIHPDDWFADNAVELVHAGVLDVDVDAKTVTTAERTFAYQWLVLATGAGPSTPPIPGGDAALVLRSLADATRLRDAAADAKSAVVIGAGFIGCEAAASLARQGVSVTLVASQRLPQLHRLGEAAGERIVGLLRDSGVRYVGEVKAEAIVAHGVRLDSGQTCDADLVVAATGVTPRSELGRRAGLDTRDGRIVVDQAMRSSADGVFAAGDVALAYNAAAGRHLVVEHWGDALGHGSIAGANAAGAQEQWDSVPGFWTTIADATLKYHAWGDGHQRCALIDHGDGFTVWYESDGATVGVLTCNADDDYELGERLIANREPVPVGLS